MDITGIPPLDMPKYPPDMQPAATGMPFDPSFDSFDQKMPPINDQFLDYDWAASFDFSNEWPNPNPNLPPVTNPIPNLPQLANPNASMPPQPSLPGIPQDGSTFGAPGSAGPGGPGPVNYG